MRALARNSPLLAFATRPSIVPVADCASTPGAARHNSSADRNPSGLQKRERSDGEVFMGETVTTRATRHRVSRGAWVCASVQGPNRIADSGEKKRLLGRPAFSWAAGLLPAAALIPGGTPAVPGKTELRGSCHLDSDSPIVGS